MPNVPPRIDYFRIGEELGNLENAFGNLRKLGCTVEYKVYNKVEGTQSLKQSISMKILNPDGTTLKLFTTHIDNNLKPKQK